MSHTTHTLLCDFCSDPTSCPARIVADSFVLPPLLGLGQLSVGDWAACESCAALLGRDDWQGLIARVTSRCQTIPSDWARNYFTALYALLRTHMHGIQEATHA